MPLHDRLIRALASIAKLSAGEIETISALPLRVVEVEPNVDVVHEGASTHTSCLVLDGLLCRHKSVAGRRQILSLHPSGDIPDLHSLYLSVMDAALGPLLPSRVAFISHRDIREAIRREPGVGATLWRVTLIDGAIFRSWLASVGRRSAHHRLAHLYCEMFVRLEARGLTDAASFFLPLTQIDLADALGLSPVHINRTLQDLRRQGVLAPRGRYYGFDNWDRLQRAAEFDPGYLNLCPPGPV